MIKFLAFVVITSSICVFCEDAALHENQDQNGIKVWDQLKKRITDCFFIDNEMESVELVCDNFTGIYPKDQPCDQKGEEKQKDGERKYLLSVSPIILIVCIAIATWLIHRKLPETEPFRELNSEASTYIYHEGPIYCEISPTSTNNNTKQYGHLNRAHLPLSPVLLHYDNLNKYNSTNESNVKE